MFVNIGSVQGVFNATELIYAIYKANKGGLDSLNEVFFHFVQPETNRYSLKVQSLTNNFFLLLYKVFEKKKHFQLNRFCIGTDSKYLKSAEACECMNGSVGNVAFVSD